MSRSFLIGISTEREGRTQGKFSWFVEKEAEEAKSPSRMSVIWRENPEPTGAVSLDPGEQSFGALGENQLQVRELERDKGKATRVCICVCV